MRDSIHPGYFWIWAALLITALIRLDGLIFNITAILAILALIRLRPSATFRSAPFALALRLAVVASAIRISIALLLGVPMPGSTLFTLPELSLPEFMVGIRVGGPVTTQRLTSALEEATLFAALILAFGAANSLTTPTKLLKLFPKKLYGVGVVTTLATTLTPQFAKSVTRIKSAQHLRGADRNGFRSWARIGTPVLEDSLARSLDLASALEARGYGSFDSPTKYRPMPWNSAHSVALLPVVYVAFALPSLSFSSIPTAAILVAAILVPVILK